MSIITRITNAIDDFLVPRDGLRDQAAELIAQHDPDGDGRIDVSQWYDPAKAQHLSDTGILGTSTRGFLVADAQGNQDGSASLREVRALLAQYDLGTPWNAGMAGDGRVEGAEFVRMLAELATMGVVPGTTGQGTAAAQAAAGADAADGGDAPPGTAQQAA